MPNLAEFHPQIVHFVVAGAGLGIFFRWVSLTGKLKWTDQAATALIVIGAVAGWFAASVPRSVPTSVADRCRRSS